MGYAGPANGQVRAVPDVRTLRYYASLGLLDRPAAMEGRTALYGRRHLLQLVAVKRLQARGLKLDEVQDELAGLTDARLAAIARVPPQVLEQDEAPPRAPAPARRDGAFWKARPAPHVNKVEHTAAPLVQAVAVAGELTLLVTVPGALEPGQVEALRHAALPLLETLRGLEWPHESEEP